MAEQHADPKDMKEVKEALNQVELTEEQKKKKAEKDAKKNSKADAKAARQAEQLKKQQEAAAAKAALLKQYEHVFGKSELIQSKTQSKRTWTRVGSLSKADDGKEVLVRARVHTCRCKGKMGFIVLRGEQQATVQALLMVDEKIPKEMISFAGGVPCESIVDVGATVTVPPEPVTSTTQHDVELKVNTLHVVSESQPVLPFQYDDAARSNDNSDMPTVHPDTRLNTRWLDMRTPASNSVFRVQSKVCQYFREWCLKFGFTEIHSPKMIGTASEGGANVFKLDYFGRPAFLAQSPQLYKQMALQGDLEGVFEVAPVFRAENANTHRHLTEFVGLDVELVIHEHYYEVLDFAEGLFNYIFCALDTQCHDLLDRIQMQYPFTPLVHQVPEDRIDKLSLGIVEEGRPSADEFGGYIKDRKVRSLRIPYPKAIALLNTVIEEKLEETEDINTENEKRLGQLIKERYGVDFYISDMFPSQARPFYTMPCPADPRFSNSYDIFIRGEEISSGAQRIHDAALLETRASALGIDPASLKDYIDSFRLGAWPHGGFGVGMERVVMLYLGLKNIRYASLFPRDPRRCTP